MERCDVMHSCYVVLRTHVLLISGEAASAFRNGVFDACQTFAFRLVRNATTLRYHETSELTGTTKI